MAPRRSDGVAHIATDEVRVRWWSLGNETWGTEAQGAPRMSNLVHRFRSTFTLVINMSSNHEHLAVLAVSVYLSYSSDTSRSP